MIIKSTLILDSEYFNYINNLIDKKYSYILNLNIYSELLIDNIDICFYYLVFNDLNILLDNNNKKIIKNLLNILKRKKYKIKK